MRSHLHIVVLGLAASASLGGCSSEEPVVVTTNGSAASVDGETAPGNGSLFDVGGPAAATLDCAGVPASPETDRDILGITLGMAAKDAELRLKCANSAYRVEMSDDSGFSVPALPDGRKPMTMLTANAGIDTVDVFLAGLPGQEKTIAIRRHLEFGAGSEPPVDTLLGTLGKRYGQPDVPAGGGPTLKYEIAFAPDGQRIGRDSAIASQCSASRAESWASVNINTGCGLTANVVVTPKSDNPGLVRRLDLSLVDQRAAYEALDAYKRDVQQLAERQRNAEVDAARRAVDDAGADKSRMPKL